MATRFSRLRHIHFPDSAPHYPPFDIVKRVERHVRQKFREGRDQSLHVNGLPKADHFRPPPTVLSFTCAPVYFLNSDNPRTRRLAAAAVEPVKLRWRKSPARKAPDSNFDISSIVADKAANSVVLGDPFNHSYKPDLLEPLHDLMPPYHGPGRLIVWPMMDLAHDPRLKAELAVLLARTTSAMLKREFGITTFADAEHTSLRVESGAQIAAIWPVIKDDVTTCGITINMAQPIKVLSARQQEPDDSADVSGDGAVTTVAAELASMHELAKVTSKEDRRFVTLLPFSSSRSADERTYWYTRTYDGDTASFAPLGMDNYGFGTSWAYELARTMDIPLLESKGAEGWDLHDFSQSKKSPRLAARTPVCNSIARAEDNEVFVGALDSIRMSRVPDWHRTQMALLRNLTSYSTSHKLNMGKLKKLLGEKPRPSRLNPSDSSCAVANLQKLDKVQLSRDCTSGDTTPVKDEDRAGRDDVRHHRKDQRVATASKEAPGTRGKTDTASPEAMPMWQFKKGLPDSMPKWKRKVTTRAERKKREEKARSRVVTQKVWSNSDA